MQRTIIFGYKDVSLMRVIFAIYVASIANHLIVEGPVHYERVRNASNQNDTHQFRANEHTTTTTRRSLSPLNRQRHHWHANLPTAAPATPKGRRDFFFFQSVQFDQNVSIPYRAMYQALRTLS